MKKALITGGERGIGRGIAIALAKEGYDIAFSYYPIEQNAEEAVRFTTEAIRKEGREVCAFQADLSVREGAKKLFDEAIAAMSFGADTDYFWDKRFLDGADAVQEDFWDELGKKIPLKRVAETEDIANAVVFLSSEKASYITGVTLRVDGGLILPGMPEGSSNAENGWS